jgi:hypothetical protein
MKRSIETETSKVATGKGPAVSSHRALFFNLISPHTLRRLAKRLTAGAEKYGSVQWRQGINDAEYVADRFNHLVEHLLRFMEAGNEDDDNIGAMLWALNALSEVERLCPLALNHVVGVSNLFAEKATAFHSQEMKGRQARNG